MIAAIDALAWDTTLSRRTQHYGHRFDYATKSCVASSAAMPSAVSAVFARLRPEWWGEPGPGDACTVNEYVSGQGIAPHVDSHSAYKEGIAVLSLGDGIALRLRPSFDADDVTPAIQELWLPQRSFLELVGESRYAYTHGIASRKGDVVEGTWIRRTRRISLTSLSASRKRVTRLTSFRQVPTSQPHACICAFPRWCDVNGGVPRDSLIIRVRPGIT